MANIITKRYGKIKPPLGAFLDRGHPLAQGMVGGWLFNEGGGNQVLDITGNANHGTLTNMDPSTDWVGGPRGPALDFGAGDDTVILSNLPVNITLGAMTTVIIAFRWSGVNSAMLFGWNTHDIWFIDGNFGFNTFSGDIWGMSSSGLANVWTTCAFVFVNGSVTSESIYINGLKQSLSQVQGTPANANAYVNASARISGVVSNPGYKFGGIIDYVYIYSSALTSDQIAWLYQEPFAMFEVYSPARYFSIAAGGPFLLNVAGAMASSGSILNQPRRGWDGAMASSGLLIDKAGKIVAGSMSSSGLLSGESRKVFAGAMSSSGSLTILTTRLVALAGSMVSAGAILLQPRKLFTGAMSGVGTLTKRPEKVLSGAMASSGAASQLITKIIALLGSMASAGALLLRPGKVISGTMSGAGTLVKSLNKALSGGMASSGEVKKELRLIFNGIMASSGNALKQAGKLFSGAMGSSGIAAHSLTRILTIAGSMVSSGVLQKSISKLLDSSMASSGILSKSVSKILVGILTSTGIAILQVTGRAIQIFYQLDVEAQKRIDTVEAQKRIDTILK